MECRKCGEQLPSWRGRTDVMPQGSKALSHQNRELYAKVAAQWCDKCRRKFLREVAGLRSKVLDAIDAQDGKHFEARYGHRHAVSGLKQKDRL